MIFKLLYKNVFTRWLGRDQLILGHPQAKGGGGVAIDSCAKRGWCIGGMKDNFFAGISLFLDSYHY